VQILPVLLFSILTFQRAGLFANGEALWRDTLARNPSAWCAHNNLGIILADQQDDAEAKEHFLTSLGLKPDNAQAHSNLGIILAREGQFEKAEEQFRSALQIKPRDPHIQWAFATALVRADRVTDGLEHGREALRLEPGITRQRQFATLLYQTGHRREAIQAYREILHGVDGRRGPFQLERSEALSNLAWLLATSPEDALRDGPEAVRLAEQACTMTEYKNASVVAVLAAAYAEAGRFPEAVTMAEKAVDLQMAGGNMDLASRNQALAEMYRKGQKYREGK
jgi:Flp pilus assembly protein TadD